MSLQEILTEKPELKAEIDKMVEAQATSIAEKTSQGLLAKNNQLLDELKPLKDLRKKLGDDFSVEEYQQLKQEISDKEKQGFVEKGQIDKLVEAHTKEKEQWKSEFDKTVQEREQLVTQLKKQLETEIIDNQLTQKLAPIAVDEPSLEYLLIKARERVEMAEDGDKRVARVKDGVKGDGTYKTIDDLVSDIKESPTYERFVKGNNATGSGATNTHGGAGKKTVKRADFDQKPPSEQMVFIKEGGKIID